jgi:hypothetical protein
LKLYRSKLSASEKLLKLKPEDGEKHTISGKKYKKRKLCELNFDDRRSIIISTLVDLEKYQDVAQRFNVSPALISYLVSKVKKNPKYLDELLAGQSAKNE